MRGKGAWLDIISGIQPQKNISSQASLIDPQITYWENNLNNPWYKFAMSSSCVLMTALFIASVWAKDESRGGLNWKEDVALPGGDTEIVVRRHEEFNGLRTMDSGATTSSTSFSFDDPSSGKEVSFKANGAYRTVALFRDAGGWYLILEPGVGGVSMKEGCPKPNVVMLKYENGTWRRPPFPPLKIVEVAQNMTIFPKGLAKEIEAGNGSTHFTSAFVRRNVGQRGLFVVNIQQALNPTYKCGGRPEKVPYPKASKN